MSSKINKSRMYGLEVFMLIKKAKRLVAIMLVFGLLIGVSSLGFCAETNHFKIAPGDEYTVMVPTGYTVGHHNFAADFFYSYADNPLELKNNGITKDVIKQQHLLNLVITFGTCDCSQVSLIVPYVINQQSDIDGVSERNFGDVILSGKYRFPNENDKVSFAVAPYLQFSTGDQDGFIGADSSLTGGIRGIVSGKCNESLLYTFNLGYAYQEKEDLLQIEINHSLLFGAGLTYIFPNMATFISGEIYGRSEELFNFKAEETPVEAIVSLGYKGDAASVLLGGGIGLVNGYGASDWRFFTGMRFGI